MEKKIILYEIEDSKMYFLCRWLKKPSTKKRLAGVELVRQREEKLCIGVHDSVVERVRANVEKTSTIQTSIDMELPHEFVILITKTEKKQ